MMKVIIAGSRDFKDYELLKQYCDLILSKSNDVEIVSGTARGADQLGEKYAKEREYSIKQFPADWDTHSKAAGYIRNAEMADYADGLIAFWDGKSRGTKGMLETAKKKGLAIRLKMV